MGGVVLGTAPSRTGGPGVPARLVGPEDWARFCAGVRAGLCPKHPLTPSLEKALAADPFGAREAA